MCKTDEKTRQSYFFTARQNILQKLRKLAFAKTHHELIIDFGRRKRNQIQQHITANIWENNKNSCKTQSENKKSSNFSVRRATKMSRRCEMNMKVVNQKDEKNKPIILRSVVF